VPGSRERLVSHNYTHAIRPSFFLLGTHVTLHVAPPTAQTLRSQSVTVTPTAVHIPKLHNALNKIGNIRWRGSDDTFYGGGKQ
jgi:hypothetical protein